MTTPGIAELVGIFLLVLGCGAVVAAASFVAVALAVLTAGLFVIFAGVLVVYLAAQSEASAKAKARS